MKKLKLLLLAAALTLSVCACGGNPADNSGQAAANGTDTTGTANQAVHHNDDHTAHNDHTGTGVTAAPDDAAPADTPDDTDTPDANVPEQPPEETANDAPAVQSQPVQQPEPKSEQKPASNPAPAPAPQPEPEPEPAPAPAPDPEPEPAPAPAPEPEPELAPQPAADPKATAQGLVGHSVSELYAAVGYPISSDYAPSCLDLDGEDGELVYDGFTVYTLKVPGGETVESVF